MIDVMSRRLTRRQPPRLGATRWRWAHEPAAPPRQAHRPRAAGRGRCGAAARGDHGTDGPAARGGGRYAKRRDQWERRSCGAGSKGRFYDWTCFTVRVEGLEPADGFEHQLLIRRSTRKKKPVGGRIGFEYAYFLVHAPTRTPAAEAIVQAGTRWQVEEENEQGKQLTGLDQYQVRKWRSWHRYITCVMFAHAFLAIQRARHLAGPPEITPDPTGSPPPARTCPLPAPTKRRRARSHRRPDPSYTGPMIRLALAAVAGLLAVHRPGHPPRRSALPRPTPLAHRTPDRSRHQPLPAPRRPPPTPPPSNQPEPIAEGRSAAVVPDSANSRDPQTICGREYTSIHSYC